MITLKVFISRYENSFEAAQKICEESKIKSKIIYIEDFVESEDYSSIVDSDIIHFSCNSKLIYSILERIKDVKCYIFNKNFLLKKYSKLDLQLIMKNNGILVPQIYHSIKDIKLPVFCKENIHTGIIFEAFTPMTIKKIFSKFDEKDFYFEENVCLKNSSNNEMKFYYSNGKLCPKNNKKVPNYMNYISDKIKNIFDIEIYSIDIIKSKKGIYVIDFNPAVGFYLSDKGRKGFCEAVNKIVEKKNEN